ncbi:DUF2017 domain-containing protein [Streptomyces sp. NA02950]|uniref:DUF2017 domain-containing protein n=1 Tax=Streptomyces sp. NA02950 TaxID=2742137 RepID=UPI00159172EB|nr:DUF2017 domain-containing protein [Streptomyces sp. NA02950]QKV94726.1 DUF2017 domain-containing protein [Streptomyces sp. NA02950]
MSGRFEPLPDGGAALALDEVEISILRSLAVQLAELIGPGDQPDGAADPLDALFAEGPSKPPADPALARLFPDAYVAPDAELGADEEKEAHAASAEFRRYTENDLRARKREDALAMVRDLDALTSGEVVRDPVVLELAPEGSRQWLGALNDLRLAIGTRLEVTDDDDGGELLQLPDSDPRKPMVMAYFWLGGLQETLVETLLP